MDNKKIIIIALVAIIAVLAIGIGYALLAHNVEYENINISNGTTIDVPKADDASWKKDSSGIKLYACPSKHTAMTAFNSQEDMGLTGAAAYALSRDVFLNGANNVEIYKNYQIKENSINGTHYYIVNIVNNDTHDNIVIAGDDLNIIKHMLDSLAFGLPGNSNVNATLEDSQQSVSVPSSNNTNKYSEEDLRRASEEGYNNGYLDGYDDYYDDYYDYDDYGYDSSSSSGSSSSGKSSSDDGSSSSGGSSDVETTTG